MKCVCMIPARANSKRVPRKNLRILYDKPLVVWAINAAKEANCFEDIYLNSEDDIFKTIAEENGIKFYKRPEELSSDTATNDDFMYDFLQNIECDAVVQLLPTSPFLQPEFVKFFCDEIKTTERDALISMKEIKIECLYRFDPINFSVTEKTKPSQELTPVMAYACSPMAWKTKPFMENYESKTGAYHANGNANLIRVSGYAAIDIDTEEDWQLAEVVAEKIALNKKTTPQYYVPGEVIGVESNVPDILAKDGVKENDLFDVNNEVADIVKLVDSKEGGSWSKRVIDSASNSMTLICQDKGGCNRLHKHYNWDEVWWILRGEWKFEIEGRERVVSAGDIVFIERGKKHRITSLQDGSIRFAVSRSDVPHVYVKE